MAQIVKMFVDVPADVKAQSDRAKRAYPFASDAKDFIIAPAEVEGLLPLPEAIYAPRGLKADTSQHNATIRALVAKADAEFGTARKFAQTRSAAEKVAQRAMSIWHAIEMGDAKAAEEAVRLEQAV